MAKRTRFIIFLEGTDLSKLNLTRPLWEELIDIVDVLAADEDLEIKLMALKQLHIILK